MQTLNFIHIGKCAGTSLQQTLDAGLKGSNKMKLKVWHHTKPEKAGDDDIYAIFVRNPIHRFVSAFNFSKSIVDFDCRELDPALLNLENCPAPIRIRYKLDNGGIAFDKDFDSLITSFDSACHLAESITARNYNERHRALKLMSYPREHIFKGIGYYLDNGVFVNSNLERIFFVGKTESLTEDIDNLCRKLDISSPSRGIKLLRRTNERYDKAMTSLAIANIICYYRNTDYKALDILVKNNLLDSDSLYSYYMYNVSG